MFVVDIFKFEEGTTFINLDKRTMHAIAAVVILGSMTIVARRP